MHLPSLGAIEPLSSAYRSQMTALSGQLRLSTLIVSQLGCETKLSRTLIFRDPPKSD